MNVSRKAVLLVACSLVAALALGAWLWLSLWSPSAFERHFRQRIHEGMTLGEAEAVLGKGEYRKRGISEHRGSPGGDWRVIVVEGDTEFYVWRRGRLEIWLGFLNGKLAHKFFYAPNPDISAPLSATSGKADDGQALPV